MTMRSSAQRKSLSPEQARMTAVDSKGTDMMPTDLFTRAIVLEGPLNDDRAR
jgi:putative redox protein